MVERLEKSITSTSCEEVSDKSIFENILTKKSSASNKGEVMIIKGKVSRKLDALNYIIVTNDGDKLTAKKASSCLVIPEVESEVLFSFDPSDGECYILHILSSSKDNIDISGDLVFYGDSITFNTNNVNFKANSFDIKSQDFALNSSKILHNSITYSLNAENYVSLLGNSVRNIVKNDEVNALNFSYTANGVARINGQLTYVQGNDILKYDGKLILAG